jgi:hypothetical protein
MMMASRLKMDRQLSGEALLNLAIGDSRYKCG